MAQVIQALTNSKFRAPAAGRSNRLPVTAFYRGVSSDAGFPTACSRFVFLILLNLVAWHGALAAQPAPNISRMASILAQTADLHGGPSITYRKVFKSSYPEFIELKVDQSGMGTLDARQLDEDPNPQRFEIGAPIVQKIFDLADKLHDFQGIDLEVHRRLANLGAKTFHYQKGAEVHEVTFNYTIDASANQLLGIFEGITRQETDLSDLKRTMRYDHLGVNDVLIQIETDYNSKILPEPERFVTTLDQLAADEKFIDIARQRARTLSGRIQTSH